ncbi:MAG TPA: ABC transporter substrate-binding protein, partial [Chloroflexia bacterium]|nr:ABC transporter substrate-binding protein [Chloroflexia bacterium]
AGNPLSSTQAINSVYAVALAAGGSLDNARPGLDFFARLRQGGQLVPLLATQRTLADGRTPIVLRWDYNALSDQAALQGRPPITVVVPSKGVLAGIYVQGISAFAPHPHAARLWMEYLYSDAGQLGWLRGYCHPIRYNDLATRNAIPADLAARLPAADIYAHAQFPTLAQFTAAQAVITAGWNPIVGVTIK